MGLYGDSGQHIYERKMTKTFEQLGVSEPLRRAIEEMGFETPMPVQEMVIPHLLNEDGDVVALAQTGTGNSRNSRNSRCCSAPTLTSTLRRRS